MQGEPIVELQNIKQQYDNHVLFSDLFITVYAGEMVAITGPSGSGKSTILNIIGLLESPDDGVVRLFGEMSPKLKSRAATALLRSRIGYVFQNYALIDDATVKDNLDIPLMYKRASQRDKRALRQSALTQVELPDVDMSRKIYTLSGGEQQRVALARLLLKPCELILADEPTGSLDAENRDAVIRILKQLHKNGRTVIVVTHDTVVANACDRIVVLSRDVQE